MNEGLSAENSERDPEREWIWAAVRRYEEPLVLYAARLLGDSESARDVVQETFLKLCTQQRRDIEGHLAEWLFSVCRNQALDLRRKEKRMTPLTASETEMRAGEAAAPPDPIERSEYTAQVFAALGTLPENQQEVIRLKFQHGLS